MTVSTALTENVYTASGSPVRFMVAGLVHAAAAITTWDPLSNEHLVVVPTPLVNDHDGDLDRPGDVGEAVISGAGGGGVDWTTTTDVVEHADAGNPASTPAAHKVVD